MAGIRTLEMGFPDSVKTYTNESKVIAKVKEYTDRIHGMCNVRVVIAGYTKKEDGSVTMRYTAMLSRFSEEGDILTLARAGFPFVVYR